MGEYLDEAGMGSRWPRLFCMNGRTVDENFIVMKLDEKNSRQSKSGAVEGYNSCFGPTQLAWLTHTIGKGEVAVV